MKPGISSMQSVEVPMHKLDLHQVLVSVRYGLKQEFRVGSRRSRILSGNIALFFFMLFTGIYLGFFALSFSHELTRAFFLSLFGFCYTFIFMLMEYSSIISGPTDFQFFSSRPVNRTTYFTAKILLMTSIAGIIAFGLSIPYAIIQLIVYKSILNSCLLPVVMLLSTVLATFFVCTIYVLLAAIIPRRIIKEVSSVLQLLLLLGVYLCLSFVRYRSVYSSFSIEKDSPLWFIPGGWAAALFAPWAGGLQSLALLLYIFFFVLLFLLAVRIVKLDYREQESGQVTDAKGNRPKAKICPGTDNVNNTKYPETLVINKLFYNQLRYNSTFRTGLIAVLSMTIFYFILVVFINRAPIEDPFTVSGRITFIETYLIYTAIGLSVLMVKNQVSYSTDAAASWFLYTAPVQRGRYVKAARNLALRIIFFPYLFAIASVYALFTGNILHTIMHFTVVTLILLIATSIVFYLLPMVPFSAMRQRGQNFKSFVLNIMIAVAFPLLLIPVVYYVYPYLQFYPMLLGGLIIIIFFLERFGPRLADRILRKQAWV